MRCLRQSIFLGLIVWLIPVAAPQADGQEPGSAPEPSIPETGAYVPGLALGALVVRPQSFIQYPELNPEIRMFPVEVAEAWGKENFGINPLALAELKVVFGMPMGPQPPPFGIVFTFLEDFDPENISSDWLAPGGPRMMNGRKVYPLALPDANLDLVLEMIDSKSGLIGDVLMLQSMRAAAQGTGPLAELLKKNPIGTANFQTAVTLQPLRPLLAMAVQNPPPDVPEELHALIRSSVLINSIIWRLRMDNGTLITRYEILADNPAGAAKLYAAAEQAIEYGRNQLRAEMDKAILDMEPGPVTDAVAAYSRRITDAIITALQPRLKDDRLIIDYRSSLSVASAGVLVGLLLPAVQAAREAARRMNSSNNLKQIALAMHNYHETHKSFPAGAITDPNGKPLLSWRVALLPYLEEQALYERFRLDEAWDSPHNRALLGAMPQVYAAPGAALQAGHSTYHAAIGERLALSPGRRSRFQDIVDGTSNTLLVLEGNPNSQVPWTSPDYLEVDDDDPLANFRGARPGGFNAVFADGAVHFLADTIDPDVFRALLTRAGSEQVALP